MVGEVYTPSHDPDLDFTTRIGSPAKAARRSNGAGSAQYGCGCVGIRPEF